MRVAMTDAGGRIDERLSYRCGDTSRPLVEETIGDALRTAAAEVPDRPALVEGSPGPGPRRRLSYAELLGQAERVARALLARFRPGEHVAVWSGNSLEWILLEYGAALAGLVLVTVNPAYQAGELSYVLRQSRSAGLFHVALYRGNRMADIVAEVRDDLPHLREVVALEEFEAFSAEADPTLALPSVRPRDRVQIQYTSGTTGLPERCVAAPFRDGRQRTADRRTDGRASRRRVGVADAAVPHGRLRYGGARGTDHPRDDRAT